MARFLLATWEGGGVLPPELGLAKRLIARGHEVRVLADPAAERAAKAAGCAFSPWVRAPHKHSLSPEEEVVRDWEYTNMFALFEHFLDAFMCGPADRFAADTLEVLDREPVDAMLVNNSILGAEMAAESRGIPYAVLMPNIYMRPAPGIPAFGPGLAPAQGPLGRMRDSLMNTMGTRLWRKGLPATNRARAGLGLAPLDDVFAQHDRAARVFVMTARAFDFPATSLPDNVRYVGPVLDDPAWTQPWSSPWNDDDERPFVLVALSSTYQDQLAVLGRIVQALASMPVRALVTIGPALSPDAVPSPSANVVCVPTAPHAAVLPRASAVITHCGHGTTIKALAEGVPLVCIPMGRDQNDNAARVTERGAGVRLKKNASPAAIARAVEKVLSDSSYRAGAERLRDAIAAEIAEIDLAAEAEAVLVEASSDVPPRTASARALRV